MEQVLLQLQTRNQILDHKYYIQHIVPWTNKLHSHDSMTWKIEVRVDYSCYLFLFMQLFHSSVFSKLLDYWNLLDVWKLLDFWNLLDVWKLLDFWNLLVFSKLLDFWNLLAFSKLLAFTQ